jgi:hypothetical protein
MRFGVLCKNALSNINEVELKRKIDGGLRRTGVTPRAQQISPKSDLGILNRDPSSKLTCPLEFSEFTAAPARSSIFTMRMWPLLHYRRLNMGNRA